MAEDTYLTTYKVRITTVGKLNMFGYNLSTPAVVDLTAVQISVLRGLGYSIDSDVGEQIPPIISTDEAINAEWKKTIQEQLANLGVRIGNLEALGNISGDIGSLLKSTDIGVTIAGLDENKKVIFNQLPVQIQELVTGFVELKTKIHNIEYLEPTDNLFYETIDDITNRILNLENKIQDIAVIDDWSNPSHTDAISAYRANELRDDFITHIESTGNNKIHHIHNNKDTLDQFRVISSLLRFNDSYVAVVSGARPTTGSYVIGFDKNTSQFVFTDIDYNLLKTRMTDVTTNTSKINELETKVQKLQNNSSIGGPTGGEFNALEERIQAIEDLELPIYLVKVNDNITNIKTLQEQIKSINTNISSLTQTINNTTTDINTVKAYDARITTNTNDIRTLKTIVGSGSGTDSGLPDLAGMQQDIDNAKSDIAALQTKTSTNEALARSAESQAGASSLLAQAATNNITTINEKITIIEENIRNNTSDIESANNELEEIGNRISALETGSSDPNVQGSITSRLTNAEKRITDLETDVSNLQMGGGSGGGTTDTATLQRITNLETSSQLNQTNISNLTTQYTQLNNTVSSNTTTIGTLQTKVSEMETIDAGFTSAIKSIRDRLTIVETSGGGSGSVDLGDTFDRLDAVEADILTVKNNINNINDDVASAVMKADQASNDINTIQESVNEAISNITNATSEVETIKGDVETLKTTSEDVGIRLTDAESNINSLSTSTSYNQTQITQINEFVDQFNATYSIKDIELMGIDLEKKQIALASDIDLLSIPCKFNLLGANVVGASPVNIMENCLLYSFEKQETGSISNPDYDASQPVSSDNLQTLSMTYNIYNVIFTEFDTHTEYDTETGNSNQIPYTKEDVLSIKFDFSNSEFLYDQFTILKENDTWETDTIVNIFDKIKLNKKCVGIETQMLKPSTSNTEYQIKFFNTKTQSDLVTLDLTPSTTKTFTSTNIISNKIDEEIYPILEVKTPGDLDGVGIMFKLFYM